MEEKQQMLKDWESKLIIEKEFIEEEKKRLDIMKIEFSEWQDKERQYIEQ